MVRNDFTEKYGMKDYNGTITFVVIKPWEKNSTPIVQSIKGISESLSNYKLISRIEDRAIELVDGTDRYFRVNSLGERFYEVEFVFEEDEVGCFMNNRFVA